MVEAKKPVAKKPVAKKPVAKKPVAAKKPAAKKPVAAKKPAAKKPAAKKPAAKKPLKGGYQYDLDSETFRNFNRDQASVAQAAEYKVFLKKQELRQAEKERDQLLAEWKLAKLSGRPGIDEGRNVQKMNEAAGRLWPNASSARGEPTSSPLITSAWREMYGAQ